MSPSYLKELERLLKKSAPAGADFCIIQPSTDIDDYDIVSLSCESGNVIVSAVFDRDGWRVWWRGDKDLRTQSRKNTRRNELKMYRIQDVVDYVVEFFEVKT